VESLANNFVKNQIFILFVLTLSAASTMAQSITSEFTANDEGWRGVRIYDAGTFTSYDNYYTPPFAPPYSATAGNPGGTISVQDVAGEASAEFAAPPSYLGDKSRYYGGSLSWDYKSTGGSLPADPVYDLVLVGAGLVLLLDAGPSPLFDVWVRRTATLTENAGWRVSSLSGRIPTGTEFQAVLADLQGIFIESDLAGGADTGFLDNVVMAEQPGIQPTLAITLEAGPPLHAVLHITGTVGKIYRIEHTTTLQSTSWVTLTNLALPTSPFLVSDPTPVGAGRRFYRAAAIP